LNKTSALEQIFITAKVEKATFFGKVYRSEHQYFILQGTAVTKIMKIGW